MKPLTIKQAGRILGMCPKTLSTVWVRRGVLKPLPGTVGQGKAMLFDPAEIQAFKENSDLVEFLALCRWGRKCGKLDSYPAGYFGKWGKTEQWKRSEKGFFLTGKPIFKPWTAFFSFHTTEYPDGKIERHPNGWIPVPDEVTHWAKAAAKALTRREVECLCAIFLASIEVPRFRHKPASYYAARKDIPAIVAKLQAIGTPDSLAYFNEFWGHMKEASIGDGENLRGWLRKWFPDDESSMFLHLCVYARQEEAQRKKANVFPSPSSIGRVMHIQRAQAFVLRERTLKMIARAGLSDGLADLFNVSWARHEPDTVVDENDISAFLAERNPRPD